MVTAGRRRATAELKGEENDGSESQLLFWRGQGVVVRSRM
jgi:hypothetical protein